MSYCLFLFFLYGFLFLLGLAFDPGTHGIQIGTEFLFGLGTHKVMALGGGALRLDLLQILPDVLYIEKSRKLIYI